MTRASAGSYSVDWQSNVQAIDSLPLVIAAWTFDSVRDGQIRPGGEVDTAALFDKLPSLDDRVAYMVQLQGALQLEDTDLQIAICDPPFAKHHA